jgi:hypothetical protein
MARLAGGGADAGVRTRKGVERGADIWTAGGLPPLFAVESWKGGRTSHNERERKAGRQTQNEILKFSVPVTAKSGGKPHAVQTLRARSTFCLRSMFCLRSEANVRAFAEIAGCRERRFWRFMK